MKQLADFTHEKPHWNEQRIVIGIDEVGRGCLAGPVYVAGVCFAPDSLRKVLNKGIHDSKKVTALRRSKLSPFIMKHALGYHIASSTVEEINEFGIVGAIQRASYKIVSELLKTLSPAPVVVFTDTHPLPMLNTLSIHSQVAIPQGDGKSISIAAASIIAKVARDAHMVELHDQYPGYDWCTNKGYATKKHISGIKTNGICPLHRSLFVRNYM